MNYIYDLSEAEIDIVLNSYNNIISKTTDFLKRLENESIFEEFFSIVFLLFDGFLSSTHNIKRDNNYHFVSFSNSPYYLYPLNGIGVCRHINEILYLLFTKLGYNCQNILINLSENKSKKKKSNNHIITLVDYQNGSFAFDLTNWNVLAVNDPLILSWKKELHYYISNIEKFKTIKENNLSFLTKSYNSIFIKLKKHLLELEQFYLEIFKELQIVAKIIDKYETYQKLNIKNVYNY